MKGKWKKAVSVMLAAAMITGMTACSGKGGSSSDALAQAADSANAKEAVFKEIGAVNPDTEWFENVLVDGEDVIVVWSEYVDVYGEDGGEAVPYEEEAIGEVPEEEQDASNPSTEEQGVVDEGGEAEEGEVQEDSSIEDGTVNEPMMPEVEYFPEEEYSFYYKLNFGRVSFGGTGMSVSSVELPEKEYSCGMSIDPNSGNYVIVTEHTEEDYSDPENYVYKTQLFMNVYTKSGELVSREELDLGIKEDEYYGIYGMGIAANGDICLLTDRNLFILNASLQMVGQIAFSDNQWVESFFVTAEGVPYVYLWTEGGESSESMFYKVDTQQVKLGSAVDAPDDFWGGARAGAGHDLYYSTDKGVYTYDFDTAEEKKILDFVDSDIDYNYVNYCVPVDETRIVAVVNDPETWEASISFMEKVPPEEVVDKTIITMGMVYTDYEIRSKVIAFNKASDQYRIRMIEYYEYNSESDWDAGQKMFNNDIITSNAPDIVVINSGMPVESFIDKGVFLNLNPYIDADPDVNKEDMAPNILALGSRGEDTYILTGAFNISTMAMKKSLVPNGETLTLAELRQIEQQYGNVPAFRDMTRDDVLRLAMEMNYSEFLDLKTGKCEFNTPAFYELLEYAKHYPAEIDWENMDDNYWMESETAIRENRAFLQYYTVGYFNNMAWTEQGVYGEEVAFVGFPGSGENTGVIYPYFQMAISKDCEHPEEAWQFMRQFYTYEGQKELDYGAPINLQVMDEQLEQAQQRPFWIDDDGNKVEYDETYWIGDREIIIQPLTAERAQEVKEYVLSVDKMYYYDASIIDIIVEEAAPFFAGQKTAEQAADIIQSRVQIYVNENM
ncbi:MAG: extracellular solute-binding protein [Lachnospiraceae bacterium]|nr:extracellular solute-binding protein [Lachnospiraceae bacterium]